MKGIKIPVGVNSSGGAATIEGDENDIQAISVAIGSGGNENAFQQEISLGEGMVFDLDDPTVRAKITRRLYALFRDFRVRKRFELKKDTITWSSDEQAQELSLEFKYINLESDEEKLLRRTFTAAD